jgi:hypothetical protein
MPAAPATHALKPTTLLIPCRHKMRATMLPPPPAAWLQDPSAVADIGTAADIVLLCVPVGSATEAGGAPVDAAGQAALSVLRSLGMPPVLVAMQGAGSSLKARAAAKKAASAALAAELPGDHKVLPWSAGRHQHATMKDPCCSCMEQRQGSRSACSRHSTSCCAHRTPQRMPSRVAACGWLQSWQ